MKPNQLFKKGDIIDFTEDFKSRWPDATHLHGIVIDIDTHSWRSLESQTANVYLYLIQILDKRGKKISADTLGDQQWVYDEDIVISLPKLKDKKDLPVARRILDL